MSAFKSIAWAILAAALAAGSAAAQTFPDRPIRIIVPNTPGGGFDAVARIIADPLSRILGQPVVVENKPGSGTLVGTAFAAKAAPDGYTLLIGGTSNMSLNPGLYPQLPYDPVKDFTSVGLIVSWPFMLIERNDLPYRTVKDVVDAARAKPGSISFASGGVGSGQYVAAAIFAHLAGLDVTQVPYNGAQAAYTDIIGGRVDLFFDNAQTALPQVKGGTVRPIAVTTAKRYAALPDLPTVAESGLAPIDMETWFGLFAPAGTPAPVLAKLAEAVGKARANPETVDILVKSGGTMNSLSVAEENAFVKSEAGRWTKLLNDAGVKGQ